jgi:hypothetical protein
LRKFTAPPPAAKPTVNPKPKAKKASSATDTEEEIDNLLSQSEEDDQSDPASQSDPDDGEFPADLTDEVCIHHRRLNSIFNQTARPNHTVRQIVDRRR